MIKHVNERVAYVPVDCLYIKVLVRVGQPIVDRLFGEGIVARAYKCCDHIYEHHLLDKEIEEVINSRMKQYDEYFADPEDLDDGLLIEFTSGKMIHLSVSEWGWLEPFHLPKDKEEIF